MSMEKINLCEGVVAQMMDTEAWNNISGNFPFSEAQLEKYTDKLDWKEVSGNSNIFWTTQMLEKFKRKLDWTALSRRIQEENVSTELLEKFKDDWNWEELSDNNCLTPELIPTESQPATSRTRGSGGSWSNGKRNRSRNRSAYAKTYSDDSEVGTPASLLFYEHLSWQVRRRLQKTSSDR